LGLLKIDGNLLKKMIIAGANNLVANKELLDSLNVFPVPDGDTGTNMSMTVMSAAKEVASIDSPNIYDIAKKASSGSLRGARGNSGVIVSQLFRGFASGLKDIDVADAHDLANALMCAQETAYKAVMKPKEGTILTVAREIAKKASEVSFDSDDIEENFKSVLKYSYDVLKKTQDMLPELKQAGVVDAGGKGIICFLEGAFNAINFDGEISIDKTESSSGVVSNVFQTIKTEDIKFAYCTEFIIDIENESETHEDDLKNFLQHIGDSIVVVVDDGLIKIHVHTNNPGKALEKAVAIGSLSSIKIENMKEQHTNNLDFLGTAQEEPQNNFTEEEKEIGFVVTSVGDGLKELFKGLGADVVIEGGQTMNPSTEDILNAIAKVNAKNVVVLPNNKNIILAANQAKELCEDKNIFVIPSKTIPQGISAMINFIPTESVDAVVDAMNNAILNIKTGQITYAVRDTVVDSMKISVGDILCMAEGDIKNVAKDVQDGTKKLIDSMLDDNSEFVSIYYGEDVTEEMSNEIVSYIEENYPECEVEFYNGKQPLYYYYISVE